MFKILQVSLRQYMNQELPDVQAGFRKGRGTRDQIANICWIIEKLGGGTRFPKKDNASEWSNYHIIVLISHASKVMLKILQARLRQYFN